MPPTRTLQTTITGIKKSWSQLAEFVLFISGVIGTFLIPPPGWNSEGNERTVVRLSQFVVAVLVGLIFLLVQKWNRKKHVGRWAIIAVAFLVLSLSAFFAYQHLLDTRTCQYAGRAVVIGSAFTPHAQSYAKQSPSSDCTTLLEDFVGKADDIWSAESINRSRYMLAATYILNMPLFTICLIAVVQALYCNLATPRR